MYFRKPVLIVLALVSLAVTMAGCSSPAGTPAATPAATATPAPSGTAATQAPVGTPASSYPANATVQIKGFTFDPQEVRVAKGGTVMWTNLDGSAHTVSFNGAESRAFGNGETFSRTFGETGAFDYICGIHPSMKGKVTVG